MTIEFKIPDLGENVESADVGQVMVAEGDTIEAEQPVLEVETEKAVFEVPCPHAGTVSKIHVSEGDSVSVGTLVLTLEETGSNGTAASAAASAEPEAKKEPEEPAKSEPDTSSAPQPSKADPEAASAKPAQTAAPATTAPSKDQPPAPAGPATRRLARQLGVDLHEITGSGPGGRITQDNVKEFVKNRLANPVGGGTTVAAPPLPDFSQWGEVEHEALNKIAKTSANNLSFAWQTVPHVTQHDLADVTDLEAARRRFVKSHEGAPKITMTVLAVKAVVAALKAYPRFNASIDMSRGELILKRYFHIGVAVDTENGLVVPVIRDCDQKSLLELAAELTDIAGRARARKLGPNDMKGGTFTISNLGGIGGTGFTPIVNYPEVAILGMARSRQEYVPSESGPVARLMLPLSLSYDHRVVNGADGARFIGKVTSLLSEPFQLLTEL
ncbi:Dihydrolipoyllysine-residue acetyltransferase component of pyruvate dehydrogenase complex [Planctomycetes bacterium Pan216]|uniref:Dihydrolipoamide acetyltransferase component of pyruvate dehydrogenase complex n=1 Tax=Kolteria novifilia TaxID=2527975 RepID=A0A518B467_9BACT|nr:Dihydrolipoyllysine-residue acetyltransferase component of pyruvate dehydrogenase complex [Planctomycetes bacterium Pan216]